MRNILFSSSLISTVFLISTTAHSMELFNDEKSTFDFNGNLSAYYLKGDDYEKIDDGFSRFIFDMSHQLKDDWQALAIVEWGV